MENYLVTATKEFTWDMAHVLTGHLGLCKNLHGHTYKMEVTVCGLEGDLQPDGPSAGMVVDFKDLKSIVQELIVEPLDHATMIDVEGGDEFELELYALLSKHNKKVEAVNFRPTAENMVVMFMDCLNRAISARNLPFAVGKIRLYETPTSYAEIIS